MKALPLVSIIIPTYNRAHLLGEAIASVLGQTLTNYEIIVVDDGSTDDSSAVLQQMGDRIRYLQEAHTGLPGHSRNAGIQVARGAYIAFLDSDDLWVANALELRLDYLRQHPDIQMVYGDAQLFDHATGADLGRNHERILPAAGWIGRRLLFGDCIPTPTVLVQREVLDDVGLFAEEPALCWGEDWDLWLRIAAKYAIGLIPEPLARVRIHAGNLTGQIDILTRCYKHLFILGRARAAAPDVYGPVYHRAVAKEFSYNIHLLIEQGQAEAARSLLTQAVQYDPDVMRELLTILRLTQATPDYSARDLDHLSCDR